jgi:hypothetical protein
MRTESLAANGCIFAFALASACSDHGGNTQQPSSGSDATGSGASVGSAGTASGSRDTASGSVSGTGASVSGVSGVVVVTGNGAGSQAATAGFDNGDLFVDAAAVVPGSSGSQNTANSDAAAAKSDSPAGPPGDGHSAAITFGFWGLTAVFTQKGTDVTVVITAAQGCPAGNHTLQIHGGFSCDTAALEGPVWDGKRGDGIPAFACDGTGRGTVTYTRSGADPTTNWTVADQNQKTDVSLHVILADGRCAAFL